MLKFSHPRKGLLVLGDMLTLLSFAALGRRAHSMGNALDDLVTTALPFVVAWLVVAPFTGVWGTDATASPTRAARPTALTWLIAFPLGILIRIAIVGRVPHISFVIVAGLFTLILLTGWRSAFALIMRRGVTE